MKNKRIDQVSVFIQIILFVSLIILFIMNNFINIIPVIEIVMAFLLFVISYNDFHLLKRSKWYSAIYIIIGLISLFFGIMGLL